MSRSLKRGEGPAWVPSTPRGGPLPSRSIEQRMGARSSVRVAKNNNGPASGGTVPSIVWGDRTFDCAAVVPRAAVREPLSEDCDTIEVVSLPRCASSGAIVETQPELVTMVWGRRLLLFGSVGLSGVAAACLIGPFNDDQFVACAGALWMIAAAVLLLVFLGRGGG